MLGHLHGYPGVHLVHKLQAVGHTHKLRGLFVEPPRHYLLALVALRGWCIRVPQREKEVICGGPPCKGNTGGDVNEES